MADPKGGSKVSGSFFLMCQEIYEWDGDREVTLATALGSTHCSMVEDVPPAVLLRGIESIPEARGSGRGGFKCYLKPRHSSSVVTQDLSKSASLSPHPPAFPVKCCNS